MRRRGREKGRKSNRKRRKKRITENKSKSRYKKTLRNRKIWVFETLQIFLHILSF